jgi:hypothetical protein
LLREGSKKTLEYEHIYETLPEDRSKSLGDRLAIEWEKELQKLSRNDKNSHTNLQECEEWSPVIKTKDSEDDDGDDYIKRSKSGGPCLIKALVRIFGWRFVTVGVFLFIEECVVK